MIHSDSHIPPEALSKLEEENKHSALLALPAKSSLVRTASRARRKMNGASASETISTQSSEMQLPGFSISDFFRDDPPVFSQLSHTQADVESSIEHHQQLLTSLCDDVTSYPEITVKTEADSELCLHPPQPSPLSVQQQQHHQLSRGSCQGTTREAFFSSQASTHTSSMFLKWNSTQGYPKCVLLVRSSIDDTRVESSFLPLARYILSRGKYLYLEAESYDLFRNTLLLNVSDPSSQILKFSECCESEVDLVITLGGDGTMLRSVSLFQGKHIPVFVSFRFGTLGFMTPHVWNPSSFTTFIEKAFSGSVSVQLRERLNGQIWTCKADHSPPELKNSRKVLNEVSIHRGLGSRVDLDIYVNNNIVTTISGDGVLVSTPTGSTGHALSAGSSLVHPNVPCVMITPICVHSLSFRPIILPSTSVIKVVPSDHSRFRPWVCFDGDEIVQLCNENGNRELIVIEPAGADSSVPCVCSDEPVGDWLKDLQERLYWNVSKTGCALTNNHTSPPDEVCSPNVSSNEDEGHSRLRKTSTLSVSMANIRLPDDAIQGKESAVKEPWNERHIDDGSSQNGNFMLVKKAYSIFEPGLACRNGHHHSFAS